MPVLCRKQGAIGLFSTIKFEVRADGWETAVKYAVDDAHHEGWETCGCSEFTPVTREDGATWVPRWGQLTGDKL